MNTRRLRWPKDSVDAAKKILSRHDDLQSARAELTRQLGFEVTRSALDSAFRDAGLDTPFSFLRSNRRFQTRRDAVPPPPPEPAAEIPVDWDDKTDPHLSVPEPPPSDPAHADLSRLAALAKKWGARGGLTLEILCDTLGLTPRAGRDLAQRAIDSGYHVDLHDGVLDFRAPESADHKEVVVDTPDVALGDEIVVGVVSDPHFASKHHERDALRRHVEWLYESGARHFFQPGDLTAGGYSFLKFEVTSTGIEDQTEEAVAFVKECGTEIQWHAIAGNHDESHRVGIDAVKMAEQMLRGAGWTNFHYYGPRAALLRLYNTRFAMHHPGGGLAYAISYKIQKYVDEQPVHRRAQFLFTGHTHQQLYMRRGGCHSFLCGTFENGDSSFGRMLGGDVAVGGWLVRYRLDERGQVAHVVPEFRSQPHRSMHFVQVPA